MGFRVLLLGYGEMGQAMEQLLHRRHKLRRYDPFRTELPAIDLADSAAWADFILFCVPASPHGDLAQRVAPALDNESICLSVAKGLDERGRTAAEIFAATFGRSQAYGLMYGPMLAEEIRADGHAFAQLGCHADAVAERVQQLFAGTKLQLEPTSDIDGISWAVILKNVYAVMFGAADELELGDNVRGYLATAALSELGTIVHRMGGRRETVYGLAGLGDLIATATSEHSHHHVLGRRLVRGEIDPIEGEGVHTLAMVRRHRRFDTSDYPLFSLVQQIVEDPHDIRTKLERGLLAHAQ